MKKRLSIALVFAIVASLFITGVASAGGPQPVGVALTKSTGCDSVMSLALSGALRPYLLDTLAQAFGISASNLENRLANGEAYYDIAISEGISEGNIVSLMKSAIDKALSLALMDGAITSAQAVQMQWYVPSCGTYGTGLGQGPGAGQPAQGPGAGQPAQGPGGGGQPAQPGGGGPGGNPGNPGGGGGGNPGGPGGGGTPGGPGGGAGGGPGGPGGGRG